MKNIFDRIFDRRNDLEKLKDIVLESWRELAENIAEGKIRIGTEEDLELELAIILKENNVLIDRQHIATLSNGTSKTPSGMSKVDLFATLENRNESYTAAIELKYFPKSQYAASTDNRRAVLMDVENLEAYIANGYANIGFALVYTTDKYYMDDTRSIVNINDTGYHTNWFTFNNAQDCFMTINVEK